MEFCSINQNNTNKITKKLSCEEVIFQIFIVIQNQLIKLQYLSIILLKMVLDLKSKII